MTDTLARLRQLEAAATPAPWRWRVINSRADADLTVAARNALPQLLAIAEAAREAHMPQPLLLNTNTTQYAAAIARLRSALAALDSQETD